jgi:cytochrome P450
VTDEEARDGMIELWITTRRKYPERMEEREIQGAATANLGAGAGSLDTTLQAFLHCATKDRVRLRRLQDELDAAKANNELAPIAIWAQV